MIDVKLLEDHPRFKHSVGVMEMALKLNEHYHYGIDKEKIKEASLLHDITKNLSDEENLKIIKEYLPDLLTNDFLKVPQIWHSFTGAVIAKTKYNIDDEEVLRAIFYHTTGRCNMSNLEKLIFLSDYTELGRSGEYFERVRAISFDNIDKAIVVMLEEQFKYLKSKHLIIYPLSVETYNFYKEVIENA